MSLRSIGSWLVIGGLTLLAIAVVIFGNCFSLQGDVTGALAGALIGGGGVVLGGVLERAEARRGGEAEKDVLRSKLKTLITAELVGTALGYVTAYKFVANSLEALKNGAPNQPGIDLSRYAPAPLSWASALLAESLVLTERQLDILATLSINMVATRKALGEIGQERRPFGLLSAGLIKDVLAHDMGVLAEAFEEFAPSRRLRFSDEEPELASAYLRRITAEPTTSR